MAHDLNLTRLLPASPAHVWRCLTEPELLKKWFAPHPVETIEAIIEPHPGGRFYTVMRVPDHGDTAGDGCILIADPAKRLSWTNCLIQDFAPATIDPEAGGFGFSADLQMSAEGDGCRYVVTVRHANDADRAKHEAMGFHDGWGTAVDQLGALAATL